MTERLHVYLKTKVVEKYLVKNNMSCRQLAHSMGYDSAQITNWLNKKRTIGPRGRQKIMDFLKMEWDDLFEIVEESELIRKALNDEADLG